MTPSPVNLMFTILNSIKGKPYMSQIFHKKAKKKNSTKNILFTAQNTETQTSRSIISLGTGASGLSPVSSIGIPSFLISFSKKPTYTKYKCFTVNYY